MTDKELRKLSRLELLELLLTESRENERLKAELEKEKRENVIEKSAKHLDETANQLESAIDKVSQMISALDKAEIGLHGDSPAPAAEKLVFTDAPKTVRATKKNRKINMLDDCVDFDIYKSLIVFFISDPDSLSLLPQQLRETVENRIDELGYTFKRQSKNNS